VEAAYVLGVFSRSETSSRWLSPVDNASHFSMPACH
jgi:hypothetical protein